MLADGPPYTPEPGQVRFALFLAGEIEAGRFDVHMTYYPGTKRELRSSEYGEWSCVSPAPNTAWKFQVRKTFWTRRRYVYNLWRGERCLDSVLTETDKAHLLRAWDRSFVIAEQKRARQQEIFDAERERLAWWP